MMKKMLLTTALIFSGTSALADNNWYMSVDLGVQIPSGEASHEGTNSANTPSYDFENSMVGGLAVGYFINNSFRVEAEARFRNQDTEDDYVFGNGSRSSETFSLGGEVETTTIMANVIYEFDNKSNFTPYLKGGIGIAHSEANADLDVQPTFTMFGLTDRWQYPEGDDKNFAWSIGAGVDYSLSENVLVGLEYQYIDMGSVSTGVDINGDSVDFDLSSHEVTLGLTYLF